MSRMPDPPEAKFTPRKLGRLSNFGLPARAKKGSGLLLNPISIADHGNIIERLCYNKAQRTHL
jgi:hypothetical protein